MADNQKRDSKGRFKSKPKGFDAPKNVAIPEKAAMPSRSEKKQSPKPAKIRLVKNPIYQPVKAAKTMEDALAPIKDARSKRKRDKARKEMETTFGDIDWESKESESTRPAETESSEAQTQEPAYSSVFNDTSSISEVSKASSRDELIASSGSRGAVWVKNSQTQSFAQLALDVQMKFVYAEDANLDSTPDDLLHVDHVVIIGESFTKAFAIGEIAFLSNG